MPVRKKSRSVHDTETGSDGGKPEVEGETTFSEKVTLELESAGMTSAPIQPTDAHTRHAIGTNELPAQPAPIIHSTHTETSAGPSHVEMDSVQRHELHGDHKDSGSPVSPISADAHKVSSGRRDTYDDSRLVQNP